MYKKHNPIIAKHGKASSKGLRDVMIFVLSTIQTPISRTVTVSADIHENGVKSKYLSTAQCNTVEWIDCYSGLLHRKLSDVDCPIEATCKILQTPGLGVVKAAFVAQLLGYEIGCIDRHNALAFDVPRNILRVGTHLSDESIFRKVKDYASVCNRRGGSEYMWNQWCEGVAGTRYNKRLATGHQVSYEHVRGTVR